MGEEEKEEEDVDGIIRTDHNKIVGQRKIAPPRAERHLLPCFRCTGVPITVLSSHGDQTKLSNTALKDLIPQFLGIVYEW